MSNTDKAADLLEQVEQAIRNEAEDCLEELRMDPSQEDQREMAEGYTEDANDYRDIAILMRAGQGDDACEKWSDLDTASRDFLHDGYISDEEADIVYAAFGYDDDN